MMRYRIIRSRTIALTFGLMIIATSPDRGQADAPPEAATAFNAYIATVEARLAQQHSSATHFIAPVDSTPGADQRLHRGELLIERLSPAADAGPPGAMFHHWRGTAFAPGAHAADFERMMKDFNAYPRLFYPQVVRTRMLTRNDDRFQVEMRVRQKHIITVVMDTAYDVAFARLDPQHGYSTSRSTRIAEIDNPGTHDERALGPDQEHGMLWRLNTYWTYEECDGGVYVQIESVSLSRSIPPGLAWAVRPFVESVPRESLEFTLRATSNALRSRQSPPIELHPLGSN